jgi:methylated-DNA-[protein]-cysteine S-methyltransferase
VTRPTARAQKFVYDFGRRSQVWPRSQAGRPSHAARAQRDAFDLPLKASGTEFDRLVWGLISQVPYGQTTTYGELARRLGNGLADGLGDGASPQDVGAAVGRNPLCVIIPCHRVVGSTGRLTGYAGGLERKRALLDIEQGRLHLGDLT